MWARADVEWTDDDAEFKRQYFALVRCFNPIRFDARAIARTARRCGFRYVTFTTKHHDGFCLWDTKSTGYKTTSPSCPYSSSENADIVKRLFDACRTAGGSGGTRAPGADASSRLSSGALPTKGVRACSCRTHRRLARSWE
jgi:alpha-L-fucosidase